MESNPEYKKIDALVKSGILENIEMAFMLSESQKIGYDWASIIGLIRWINYNTPYKLDRREKGISRMAQLTYLRSTGRELKLLPENIGMLTNLEYIDLRGNSLTNLPESIGTLSKLGSLRLDNNNITNIPNSIKHLTNLTYLNLQGNKIKRKDFEVIESLIPHCHIDIWLTD